MLQKSTEDLNEASYIVFVAKAYERPGYIFSEMEEELQRIKYLKRLFRKYKTNKVLKVRLILNHLIILYNIFGAETATRLLFFKIKKEDWDILKSFLIFLSYMPDIVRSINREDIRSSDIPLVQDVIDQLRKI